MTVMMRDQGSNDIAWPHWTSPKPLVDRAKMALGDAIDLDPCSNPESIVDSSIKVYEDGRIFRDGKEAGFVENGGKSNWTALVEPLKIRQSVRPSAYLNPDFTTAAEWTRYCVHYREWFDIVLCLPSRTSSTWYHHAAAASRAIAHWGPGRISFGNPPPWSTGDKPSLAITLFYMGLSPNDFRDAFRDVALVTEHYR
jgi:hypothetical protein